MDLHFIRVKASSFLFSVFNDDDDRDILARQRYYKAAVLNPQHHRISRSLTSSESFKNYRGLIFGASRLLLYKLIAIRLSESESSVKLASCDILTTTTFLILITRWISTLAPQSRRYYRLHESYSWLQAKGLRRFEDFFANKPSDSQICNF